MGDGFQSFGLLLAWSSSILQQLFSLLCFVGSRVEEIWAQARTRSTLALLGLAADLRHAIPAFIALAKSERMMLMVSEHASGEVQYVAGAAA